MRRTNTLASCVVASALGAALIAAGCTIYGYGSTADTADGGVDATASDALSDAPSSDALPDGGDAGADATPCAPDMIATSAGCIDAFEVTVDDYLAFVTKKGGNMSGQPPECAWNATYAPQDGGAVVPGNAPVGNVDWCDAFAYCAFRGKHLCGKIGGGTNPIGADNDAQQDEWFAACSHADDGQHLYPYGSAFDASTCNVSGGGRAPVGSFPDCIGGYPGLFDMSGNSAEWTNSCFHDAAADAATDFCRLRGGSYQASVSSSCNRDGGEMRSAAVEKFGFRCCAN
ncbi:MAG: Serine/threonine kinase [Myxococcaceae bacterium]|nr:Serine/threonine kinase [Myxococcaceae bacterium]